jgi:predicted  nucleic acid-binding Zn-ribbon protein
MAATAENLRELHILHQRAKALRDRLESGPKTLAARQALLATRQAALAAARKALQDEKVQIKKREHQLQAQQAKIDDLKGKLNTVRKNEEYKAIQNQIAHDQSTMGKLEDEILSAYTRLDEETAALTTLEAEVEALTGEVAGLEHQIKAQVADHQAQLAALAQAIAAAEEIIPPDQRDPYRRVIRSRGADAFAAVENGACTGCFVSVTPQTINELINCVSLNFCKTCGRILYLAEHDIPATRRTTR